jgi:hypothetical protein
MPRQVRALLDELKTLVLSHPAVQQVQIRGDEATTTRAYLRMRLTLRSQDVVEVFVYLVAEGEVVRLQDYSLHWQRADGALLQRWDTAPHHPGIATFPSHTHRATGEVEAATAFSWNGLITVLISEVLPSGEKRADTSS